MSRARPMQPEDPPMGTVRTGQKKYYIQEKQGEKMPYKVIKSDTNTVVDQAATRPAALVKMNRLLNQ